VIFLHGLESGPGGAKALWLKERYGALTPDLQTGEVIRRREQALKEGKIIPGGHPELAKVLSGPLSRAREALSPAPDLVLGSSFGGALLLALLNEGLWTGPSLFLAGAGLRLTPYTSLPEGTRAILIHGRDDDVVPPQDSRALAATGGPQVQLWEVGDGHRLQSTLEDGTLDLAIQWLLTAR
jgi:hypothetical protein